MNKNESFLIDEEDKEVEVLNDDQKILILKKEKRKQFIRVRNTSLAMIVISILVFAFALVWQRRYDLWAISNALWLTFVIEFFIAWIFFVYNKNILSPLIHGFKVFGLMMVGKRVKEDYFTYSQRIEENPIPKYIYITMFIFSLLILIPAIITMLMIM